MPDISEIYGGNEFVKTKDIEEGSQMYCKVKDARVDKIGEKTKLLLDLENGKTLVLNKTNAKRLSEQFGPDYTRWIGKEFKLARSVTTYKSEEVPCLRVRF